MATNSVSRSRATNLTGLIDIDALVEANTLRQKQKINTASQKLKVEQYKQEQYRAIQTKAKTFYNKYCDVLSSGNFLSSSTYNTTKFTATDSSIVSATGSSKSSVTNYSVDVTTLASKASTTYEKSSVVSGNEIEINGSKFILKGKNESEIAKNLNSDLQNSGIKVEAKYSDLANSGSGGLILENSTEGKVSLEVKMTQKFGSTDAKTVYTEGSFATSVSKSNLKEGNKIKIGDTEFTMVGDTEESIVNDLNSQLSGKNLEASYDAENGKMIIKSKNSGDSESNKFTAQLIVDGKSSDLKVNLDKGYKSAIDISDLSSDKGININGQNFRLNYDDNGNIDLNTLNEQLKSKNVQATIDVDKLVIESTTTGTSSKFEVGISSYISSSEEGTKKEGTNLTATVTEGNNTYTITDGKLPDGTTITGNSVTLDGTKFEFNGTGSTKLTGKTDATELKNKITEFIKDYNELLGSINERLYETRDKSYMPLTDEDKEGLSDSEIEKLEKKAQEGLLKNDSYLTNFAEDMKQTMSTVFTSGTYKGLNLASFGITPVENYTAENGLYNVDEDKLLAALQDNPEGIVEMFSGENGIITKLKDNLYDHATGTFSRLANRAGVASGVSANTNEMTKDIEQRKKLITQMQTALQEKEDALYTRYATLESNLSALQAQQSSLTSYFQ